MGVGVTRGGKVGFCVSVGVGVGVAVGVRVGVGVAVLVFVCVAVAVTVAVAVLVRVAVAVALGVRVGVCVGVEVRVGVCVGVNVGDGVLVGVAVADGVCVGVDDGGAVGVPVEVGDAAVGLSIAATTGRYARGLASNVAAAPRLAAHAAPPSRARSASIAIVRLMRSPPSAIPYRTCFTSGSFRTQYPTAKESASPTGATSRNFNPRFI